MTKKEFIKLNNGYKVAAGDYHLHIDLGNGYYYDKHGADNDSKEIYYYLYHKDSSKKLYWAWTRKDFIEKLVKFGIIKEA